VLSHADIKEILPHRHPMLLVDAVRAVEPGVSITAIKNVTCNEPCFAHLYDRAPLNAYAYPPVLIIESFCQAAGIMYNLRRRQDTSLTDRLMLFGSLSKFVFLRQVFPGETLEHHIRLERGLTDAAVFSGEIWTADQRIAVVERVVVALRPTTVLVERCSQAKWAGAESS
jgi:3-hydroxyacyl-[acyl-carrier-protein] dehydratase